MGSWVVSARACPAAEVAEVVSNAARKAAAAGSWVGSAHACLLAAVRKRTKINLLRVSEAARPALVGHPEGGPASKDPEVVQADLSRLAHDRGVPALLADSNDPVDFPVVAPAHPRSPAACRAVVQVVLADSNDRVDFRADGPAPLRVDSSRAASLVLDPVLPLAGNSVPVGRLGDGPVRPDNRGVACPVDGPVALPAVSNDPADSPALNPDRPHNPVACRADGPVGPQGASNDPADSPADALDRPPNLAGCPVLLRAVSNDPVDSQALAQARHLSLAGCLVGGQAALRVGSNDPADSQVLNPDRPHSPVDGQAALQVPGHNVRAGSVLPARPDWDQVGGPVSRVRVGCPVGLEDGPDRRHGPAVLLLAVQGRRHRLVPGLLARPARRRPRQPNVSHGRNRQIPNRYCHSIPSWTSLALRCSVSRS